MIIQDETTSLAARTEQSAQPGPIRAPDVASLTGPASLLEALPVGVYVCDVAGLIVRFNQEAVQLWGRKPKQGDAADRYCGSWRLHRVDGGPLAHADCPMADVLRTGQPVSDREVVMERPDGSRITALANIRAVRDSTGAIVGAVNCFQEITERKRTEQALRHSEERHRGLAEAIAAVVWTTDADGQVDDMPQWRRLTGQSFEAARGFGWLDAIHPDDRAATREAWTRAVKLRIPCDTECRVRTAGGAYRWYNARGVPVLADDGTVREWVGVCIDITPRKQAEDKTRLLTREVNHRANNLLTIINAMMRQTRAETAAELIMAMQGRIAALSRVQTRLARDQWDRTDLLRLVGEELAPFGKDIAGRFQISGPRVQLSADAAQVLAIVIHELATNAVKYGALSVPAGRVSIEWSLAEQLVLSWTETGGPSVSPPSREGFGTRAITLLAQQLEGDVELIWMDEGLVCSLTIPARNLNDSDAFASF